VVVVFAFGNAHWPLVKIAKSISEAYLLRKKHRI